MFEHGDLAESQKTAADFAGQYENSNPGWSERFRVVEAEAASWRGMSGAVLKLLSADPPASSDPDSVIRRLSLLTGAYADLHRYDDALRHLARADALCASMDRAVCAHVLDAHASLAFDQGQSSAAFRYYSQELALARRFGQSFDEASALMNLAGTCLLEESYDDAIDWINASNKIAEPIAADDILLTNSGNLGWAYYSLGDRERAFALFQHAEATAVSLGDVHQAILWQTTTGYVLQDSGEWARARDSYRQALALARQIDSTEDIVNSLESLTHISIELGQLNEADAWLDQLDPLVTASGNRLDALDVTLARARIAAARRQDPQADALFRQVRDDPASQITMRLGAEHQLARLYEAEGRIDDAQKMYATALSTFESARAQIQREDSKLPYFANATPIYDDSIRLLIARGKSEEALAAADQSRARTLEQRLGLISPKRPSHSPALHSQAIASGAGETLLFYWLGEQQSWLWVVTPRKTTVFPLPPKADIARRVERYREALQGPEDPLASANEDGVALYRLLVAPAIALVPPAGRIAILCDGALSELNFETLIVPEPSPHYWIEDADIVSAPSLLMLGSSRSPQPGTRRLLLIGNPVSSGPDYPELSNAGSEMQRIRAHFQPSEETIFERRNANPRSYLDVGPERYDYIDFVAHGVASSTDPLDSAIILCCRSGAEDSFKLHARDIMRHPIDARLVTIAACYGGGARAYAGEGLIGLSWAFLYAGAHNVIGALWEVSDASTPLLMDALYRGLQDGLSPREALRQAKLSLLHGKDAFRRPFFWAPFQLNTGS